MKGCPVAFFSFAFSVKQIAFKLTPQLTQLTGALSMSDREPRSLEEHQAPALNNRQCHQQRAWDRQTALRALGVRGCLVNGQPGRMERRTAAQQAAARHRAAACPASAACCRAALLGTGERPKHNHLQ